MSERKYPNPYHIIRMYCVEDCKKSQKLAVKHCNKRQCQFWKYRFGAASYYRVAEVEKELGRSDANP